MQKEIFDEEDDDKYESIVERATEMKRQQEKRQAEKKSLDESQDILPTKTFITGIERGQVIDMDLNSYADGSGILYLVVRLHTTDVVTVEVTDSGNIKESNDVVRLLELHDIEDFRIDDLIGEEILLKRNDLPLTSREKSFADDSKWEVVLPEKLNWASRINLLSKTLFSLVGNQSAFADERNEAIDAPKIYFAVFYFVACGLITTYNPLIGIFLLFLAIPITASLEVVIRYCSDFFFESDKLE